VAELSQLGSIGDTALIDFAVPSTSSGTVRSAPRRGTLEAEEGGMIPVLLAIGPAHAGGEPTLPKPARPVHTPQVHEVWQCLLTEPFARRTLGPAQHEIKVSELDAKAGDSRPRGNFVVEFRVPASSTPPAGYASTFLVSGSAASAVFDEAKCSGSVVASYYAKRGSDWEDIGSGYFAATWDAANHMCRYEGANVPGPGRVPARGTAIVRVIVTPVDGSMTAWITRDDA
jgi:hypothetical protein